ncbi:hypothetical protein DFH29DRAFT_875150 [Suillus ampliporus]|nr:hypothetical protein DFH29DRAFT_875150 [Suillus ampliporus]
MANLCPQGLGGCDLQLSVSPGTGGTGGCDQQLSIFLYHFLISPFLGDFSNRLLVTAQFLPIFWVSSSPVIPKHEPVPVPPPSKHKMFRTKMRCLLTNMNPKSLKRGEMDDISLNDEEAILVDQDVSNNDMDVVSLDEEDVMLIDQDVSNNGDMDVFSLDEDDVMNIDQDEIMIVLVNKGTATDGDPQP